MTSLEVDILSYLTSGISQTNNLLHILIALYIYLTSGNSRKPTAMRTILQQLKHYSECLRAEMAKLFGTECQMKVLVPSSRHVHRTPAHFALL